MRTVLTIVLTAMLALSAALAQEYVQDFETGMGEVQSYYPAPENLKFELGTTAPISGKQYVRAVLPGKKGLEGLYVVARDLPGARLATVTAQVRGQGEVWLCLLSTNGWLYAPQTVTLTGQWQEISLAKVLVAADRALSVYFLSQKPQAGALFEVDNIRVNLAPAPQTADAAVGPWRFEAEAFAPRLSAVRDLAAALNGKGVTGDQYVEVSGLPFPRTRRPVTVYARVRAGAAGDTYRLTTRLGGNTQYLRTVKPAQVGQWEWVYFAPALAGEMGDAFAVAGLREKESAGDTALDSVVLATEPDLTPAQLEAAPLLADRRPMAVVNRVAMAPRLDGEPGDACWQQTVAATGFKGLGSTTDAEAPTTVKLCYDEQNLYILYECVEPILITAQQRRHEFRDKVTQRDGEVYEDDSAVVLLDPGNRGQKVFDFTVNTRGTVADATGTAPDLWERRDLSWNSRAAAKGQTGEGVWWVEMAVPWADLGGTPQPGDIWGAVLGRLAKARKETTAWNLCDKGFHDPVEFGQLVFGGPGPGLTCAAPATLQAGRNEFRATLTPGGEAGGFYLLTELTTPTAARREWQYVPAAETLQQAVQRFDVGAESDLRVGHAVLEAATLRPLYASPVVTRVVKASVATLRLTCAGPYQLTLNDETISRGASAQGSEIKAPLQRGPNVFALSLEQGTAAAKLEMPGLTTDASQWKLAPADAKTPTAMAVGDGSWAMAPKVGQDAQWGPVVGRAGQASVLRHTVLWEKTRVWPTPEPAYYLARGAPQHLTFIADGLKGQTLLDWTTYVAVPLEYEVVGSTGFYGTNRPQQPQFRCTPMGERNLDGKPMRVVGIKADKPLLSDQHPIMSQFEVFVRYREQAGEPQARETRFYFWSEANGGAMVEPRQAITVRLLPKLAGAQCRTLTWQLWGGWLSNMDDREMRRQVLACSQQAGFNDIVGGDRWTSDEGPRYGLKHTLGTNFEPWCLNVGPYLKEHPAERLVKADGTFHEGRLCMTLLLGESWPAVAAALQARLDEVRPHTVDYDYEYNPFDGPHSCYCPRCLQAFRGFAKLPAETDLTPARMKEQYRAQWVDFMCRRVAEMFARFTETTHRLAPGTLFSTYSGYQTADNPERYGIDWRHIGDLKAVDRGGAGYGRPLEAITATLAALKGIPLLGGALLVPYDTSILTPQTPLTKAWLLRVLLDSTGGVLVYDRLTMDGRSWYAMAETTRLVAAHESVFLQGQRGEVAGQDPALVQTVTAGRTTLVCALNQSGKPLALKFALPAGAGAGQEYYSGRAITAGERLEITLPPGEAAVYVLRR